LLVWLGEDLPGAVRVVGVSAPPYRVPQQAPLVASGSVVLRASLAGVQWKVALSRVDDGRFNLPLRGGDADWIAKFQSTEFPRLVQVEHATMCWARAAGLDVPTIEVIDAETIDLLPPSIPRGDGKVLLVRRFDRTPAGRVHFEDFAQILDRPDQYGGSFEELGRFISSECPEDTDELIRRVAFMICSGNADAHLKNWAVTYPEGTRGRLSPAFDQVATVVFPQLQAQLALRLNGEKDMRIAAIGRETLAPLANALKLEPDDLNERLVRSMRGVVEAFDSVAATLSPHELKALRRHHGALQLLSAT
jgi:serine/threonine-protein kinase HipA